MDQWINHIAKHHKDWVKIVRSFGEDFLAEDIVQESYIRLWKYSSEELVIIDGEINRGYMYFVLRNTYLLTHRANKPTMCPMDYAYNLSAEDVDTNAINNAYQIIMNKMDAEINSWHWFDSSVFKEYRDTQISMRKMAKQSHISTNAIFSTIKSCKNRLADVVREDWQDYTNGDYEHIKIKKNGN